MPHWLCVSVPELSVPGDAARVGGAYGVRNRAVRQLLIDYISHRVVAGMDYNHQRLPNPEPGS